MKYEEIFIPNKEEVRARLLSDYGRDIAEADCWFSSRNYALIFAKGCRPAVIRLNVDGAKTRADVMSELLWVDDLRLSIPTVAQAIPSENHQIAEEFTIGENHYCATMFRKANGDKMAPEEWNPDYFRRAGRLLGQIHAASHEAGETGFCYKRRQWYEMPLWDFEHYPHMNGYMKQRGRDFFEEVRALREEPDSFGMIHGDYQHTNLFSDWDDVWAFDFDDCCYGHYIYDAATFIHLAIGEVRYHPEGDRGEVIWGPGGVVEHFRRGYEEAYRLPQAQWDLLDLFIRLHIAAGMGIVCRNKSRDPRQIRFILDSQEELMAEGDLRENVTRLYEKRKKAKEAFTMKELLSMEGRMTETRRENE